jgi:NAD(P)-dependent dehydrogenase (short-subunit alcohol dehydrogenase family)
MSKVRLINGASRGLGRAFTEEALKTGHRVVATARNSEHLVNANWICIIKGETNDTQTHERSCCSFPAFFRA